MSTLYVPTDAEALSDEARAAQPEAGSLFVVEEQDRPGTPFGFDTTALPQRFLALASS